MRNLSEGKGGRLWIFAILAILTLGGGGLVWAAGEMAADVPSGQMNVGIHFGDQQAETFGDILIPLYSHRTSLVFINPRGAWNDDDEQEFNIGLGARHLFPSKNIILGGNLFYDRRNTERDNTFSQIGVGGEFLSTWLDGRVNYYLPEEGKQTADQYVVTSGASQEHEEYWYAPRAQGHVISQYGYEVTDSYDLKIQQHYQTTEEALEGFDAEVGTLLPVPIIMNYADVKAFVGYYSFAAHDEVEIAGVKGRIEIRPVPAIYLDASWYEDEDLMGSRYLLGARASVPFDLHRLSRGQNPFAGALTGFKAGVRNAPFGSRLTEMVIRDLHIRTALSEPTEIIEDRRVLEKTLVSHERNDTTEILARDVTFVDDDNQSGVEDGTWENPYRQINNGIQQAVGEMVYVRESVRQYQENVVLQDGLILWGSGTPLNGPHGSFQGTGWPVVNGGGVGPAITLANHVTVTGFELIQPAGAPVPHAVIHGQDVSGIRLVNNTIKGNGAAAAGIDLDAVNGSVFEATLWGNRIQGATGAGIDIGLNLVANATIVIGDTSVTGNGGDGALVTAIACGDLGLFVSGDYSGNGGFGVDLCGSPLQNAAVDLRDMTANGNGAGGVNLSLQSFTGEVEVNMANVVASENSGHGVRVDLYGYNSVKAALSRVNAQDNLSDGVHAVMVSGARVEADFRDNWLSGNGCEGLFLELNSGLDSRMALKGSRLEENGANGVNVRTLAPWDSIYDFGSGEGEGLSSFSGNQAFQVLFSGMGSLSAVGNWWGTPTPVVNVDYRAEDGGIILVDPVLPSAPAP